MTTRDLLSTCRRRWVTIMISLLVAVVVAAAVYALQPPVYTSTVRAYVSAGSSSDLGELQQGGAFAEQRAVTYADLVSTPAVLDPVIEELSLDQRSSELAEQLEARAESSLLEITAAASSAQLAADIAEATMASLSTVVSDIEQADAEAAVPGQPLMELALLQDAEVPDAPQSPRPEQTIGLGAALGLLLGFGAAFLRERLDSRIRTPGDIATLTAAPLLAITGRLSRRTRMHEGEAGTEGTTSASDYRRMRTRMYLQVSFDSPSSYLVTSALDGEGKTTVAVNLARSLQAAGQRVLLIEADLQAPSLTAWLPEGAEGRQGQGLIEVLTGAARFEEVIVTDGRTGLDMITAGAAADDTEDPAWLQTLQGLLESWTETYDVTIIDGPALLSASDTVLMARMTTGVLVVTRYGAVTAEQLASSLDLLAHAKARVVGMVLTVVPARGPDSITAVGGRSRASTPLPTTPRPTTPQGGSSR